MSEQNDDRDLDEAEPDVTPGLAPDDEEEAAETEQEEAPAPAPPSSEAVLKKADAENRRYHKKLDTILGPDSGHHECPACQGLGITWEQAEDELPLLQAEDAEPCPACNAYGRTITGSRNPQQMTKPCNECGERGWRNVVKPPELVAQLPTPAVAADQPIGGQFVPGRGFIPYGATEPIPGTAVGGS